MMRRHEILGLFLSLALLLFAVPAAADSEWLPHAVDGERYEVKFRDQGPAIFRMAPGQLDRTLDHYRQNAATLRSELYKLNLPAAVKAMPATILGMLEQAATAAGDGLHMYGLPSLGGDPKTFTFTDGERTYRAISADGTAYYLQLHLKVDRRVDGVRVRDHDILVDISRPLPGKPFTFTNMWHSEQVGDAVRRVSGEYYQTPRPDALFAAEKSGGKITNTLRTGDPANPKVVEVKGKQADRLYFIASSNAYRTPLPKSDSRYDPQFHTFDDLNIDALRNAGVSVVIDKRGFAYVRRNKSFDAAKLRAMGLTFVKRGKKGREAHLRHIPRRQLPR